jgi:hypothetical protein
VKLYRKVRLARREGMSERAAARHFGISRESVKKIYVRSRRAGERVMASVSRFLITKLRLKVNEAKKRGGATGGAQIPRIQHRE